MKLEKVLHISIHKHITTTHFLKIIALFSIISEICRFVQKFTFNPFYKTSKTPINTQFILYIIKKTKNNLLVIIVYTLTQIHYGKKRKEDRDFRSKAN